MKYLGLTLTLLLCILVFGQPAFGQCSGGKINGVYHTSCFPWDPLTPNFDGYIPGTSTRDDKPRVQRAITAAFGKLVFDEADYFLYGPLTVYSYRIFEGTGRADYFAPPSPYPVPTPSPTPAVPSYPTSKLIQTQADKPIFFIGEGIQSVSIRDLALVGDAPGTIGILAQGGAVDNISSFYFQFSNLNFHNLAKGIYVNALDDPKNDEDTTGVWQCDNVRLDHCSFEYCTIGVHINSNNSGWDMTSLEFLVPPGDGFNDEFDVNDGSHTFGVYLERSTYTTMDLLIGNGNIRQPASALVYVKDHANLSIRGTVEEGFRNSIFIQGGDRTSPIFLESNFFGSDLVANNSTVVSTANQFYSNSGALAQAYATGGSQIYSYGDKFCFEGDTCDNLSYTTIGAAQIVTSANKFQVTSSVPNSISWDPAFGGPPALSILAPTNSAGALLRLGRGSFWFDITRSEADGSLTFKGNQNDYSQYVFDTANGGRVTLNNDGSVTYGTVPFLGLGTAVGSGVNGTVVYCSNCLKTSPCTASGTGALAKRIHNAWDCS